jgi:quinol monooxygenase YgiN
MKMIYVVATVTVAAGRREEVLAHFAHIVPMVREETGCLMYAPAVDLETNIDAQIPARSEVITVVEQWESLEALETHLMAPHMIEFRGAVQELVRSVSLQIVQPAGD